MDKLDARGYIPLPLSFLRRQNNRQPTVKSEAHHQYQSTKTTAAAQKPTGASSKAKCEVVQSPHRKRKTATTQNAKLKTATFGELWTNCGSTELLPWESPKEKLRKCVFARVVPLIAGTLHNSFPVNNAGAAFALISLAHLVDITAAAKF